ncbi:MAG: hypothetical protein AAF702_10255 [Chloroflexota bacterium]
MVSRWTITVVPDARAEIYKVPRGKAADVTDAISALGKDPKPEGSEEIEEEPNIYKIQVGEYTIEYELIEQDKEVKILVVR